MATREQVRKLLGDGHDYRAVGQKLGIPAGQAYLIATGVPADGGDTIPEAETAQKKLLASSQDLANPPHENPTSKQSVRQWMAARVAADEQMRAAARRRTAEPPPIEDPDDTRGAITVLGRQAPKRPGGAVKAAAGGAAAFDKPRDVTGDRPARRKGKPEEPAGPERREGG